MLTLAHDFEMVSSARGLVPLTAMWFAMMAMMMAPTAWPWLRAFHGFAASDHRNVTRVASTLAFASGYLAVWMLYSIAAGAAQALMHATLGAHRGLPPLASASVLFAAGTFQFMPLKGACLAHCRNPLSYFLAKWSDGPPSGFRLGFGHGLYCVGCCWALMATALAVGAMNPLWMALLALVAFVEQVVPRGAEARRPIGVLLLVAGILQFY